MYKQLVQLILQEIHVFGIMEPVEIRTVEILLEVHLLSAKSKAVRKVQMVNVQYLQFVVSMKLKIHV